MGGSTPVVAAVLATALLACSPLGSERVEEASSALGQPLASEMEPNGGSPEATLIAKDGVVRANIRPDGDEDWFWFMGAPGERVFAATMTAFSPGGVDSVLDLLKPDGTLIETDNDDGSFTASASSIAGAEVTQPGAHYLRVRHATASSIRPYDLHVATRVGLPTAESEPNDAPLGQPLPASGWVSGAIASAADTDVFTLALSAGDTVFASLDLDPERDGAELGGTLSFGPAGGGAITANDPGHAGPDSEALFATVKAAGTYSVGVASAMNSTGTYHLSVSVQPAATGNCTTYSGAALVPIPAGPGEVTSTIDVPGNPRIADIDVSLKLTHASPPDLDVVLESPRGSRMGLFTDVGSSTSPLIDVTVDDEAAFPVSAQPMLNGLAVQPEADYRLDWLDGEDAGGTWTLRITDDAPMHAGTLTGWSLTICEPPPAPACPSDAAPTMVLQAGFEADDGGFTHTGTLDSWARGAPANGPNFVDCNGGAGCFKTNLGGNYPNGSSQDLVSPEIDLGTYGPPVRASWAMKYQMESATYDHAWIEVREVGGQNPTRLFEWAGATMTTDVGKAPPVTVDEVAGWGVHTANLDAYAGKTIQLVFHLDAETSANFPGMAIDDVSVSACPIQVATSSSGTGGTGGTSIGTGGGGTSSGIGGFIGESVGAGGATGSGGSAPRGGAGGDTGFHASTGVRGGAAGAGGSEPNAGGGATNPGANRADDVLAGGGACSLPADRPPGPLGAVLTLACLGLFWQRRRG